MSLQPCGYCGHPEQAHNAACNITRPAAGFQERCSCARFVPPTEPTQEAA